MKLRWGVAMTERSWERLGAGAGLVSAFLLLVGMLITPTGVGDDAASIARYFSGNGTRVRLAALLVTLSGVLLLWFVAHLRHLLQRAEGGVEAFSPVVLVAGVSLATILIISVLPMLALASLAARAGAIGPGFFILYDVHGLSLGALGLVGALFTATAGAAMVRREMVGPWLGWLGVAAAVVGVVIGVGAFFAISPALLGMSYVLGIVFAAWVAVASLTMLYRPEVDRAPERRAVFAPLGHPG
jgi:hypothetical protein